MPLEYEDGYVPKEPFLELHRLKSWSSLPLLKGKAVKDIKYPEGYTIILIIFEDGTELEINGEDCFDFTAVITVPVIIQERSYYFLRTSIGYGIYDSFEDLEKEVERFSQISWLEIESIELVVEES